MSLTLEKTVAVSAVLRACHLASNVFNKLVQSERLMKGDKSPVTVADFSAQAVANTILANAFPEDKIIGEEDSSDLRAEASGTLCDRVVELANEALTSKLLPGDNAQWGIGPGKERTAEQILDAIDRGNCGGGSTGRMWTLDPIDGTKGFLRGEQYAVCLAFLIDSKVQVGVIGCPNLPIRTSDPSGPKGCLFVAVRGQGVEQLTLYNTDLMPIAIPSFKDSQINFAESVDAGHSSLDFIDHVARILGITRPPLRMDSQAKYCAVARGDASAYIRMPVGSGYQEKIWDHAAGSLLIEEAGGVVTDSRGEPLDFGLGRTLGENNGIVAAGKRVHGKIIDAIRQARNEKEPEKSGSN